MVERSTAPRSMSFSRRPLSRTSVLGVAKAPNPRRSTDGARRRSRRHRTECSCTPGTCAMISCSVCAGECADVIGGDHGRWRCRRCRWPAARQCRRPTCLMMHVRASPGAVPVLEVGAAFGATRRGPGVSSSVGLARVRFWSTGGLTSIGGNWSADAVCCARAPELARNSRGTRKLDASNNWRRCLATEVAEDMGETSV